MQQKKTAFLIKLTYNKLKLIEQKMNHHNYCLLIIIAEEFINGVKETLMNFLV